MFCKNCGREIKENNKFCSSCGKPNDMVAPNTQKYMREDLMETEPYLDRDKKNKKKRKPVKIVLLLILFMAFVAGSLYFVVAVIAEFAEDITSENTYTTDNAQDDNITEDNSDEDAKQQNDVQQDDDSSGFLGIGETQDDENNNISSNTGATREIPLLTFTLSFNDVKMSMDAMDCYDYLYGEGYYDMGSMDDYYMESSKGMLTFVPAKETWGSKDDGIIDITLDMAHPSFNFTRSEDDYYSEGFEFFGRVLRQADRHVNYKDYDTDGDGYIVPEELAIMFIFAGYEDYEEFDHDATTYSCSLIYDDYLSIDGIQIDECIYTSEKDPYNSGDNQIAGIGIICHELGHAIDLPDLYDTDYSSEGLGFHCLMAGGCENTIGYKPYSTLPAPLIAWERVYLGFEEPQNITKDDTYSVFARSTDEYNILKIEDSNGYYLIENVDYKGFGKGLQDFTESPGVAIWYVDNSVINSQRRFYNNDVNDDEDEYGVMLFEANDTNHLLSSDFNYSKKYDHYHYLDGDNIFVSDDGLIIEILDNPQDEMKVKITLP